MGDLHIETRSASHPARDAACSRALVSMSPRLKPDAVSLPATATRLPAIDIAKGIGILFVVLGHNPVFRRSVHSLYEAVYLFHMPLFFFLSGVTFRPVTLRETCRKRARSLLVPYFAMGALAVLIDCRGEGIPGALSALSGVLYATGETIRFPPLWFLPCLFLVAITTAVLLRLPGPRTWVLVGIVVAGLVGGGALLTIGPYAQDPMGLPWSIDLVPFSIAWFAVGMLAAKTPWLTRWPMAALTVLAAAGVLAMLVVNGVSLDLNYRKLIDPMAAIAGAFAGIAMVMALSTLIMRIAPVARLFAYLGTASLILLMLHHPLQRKVLPPLVSRDMNAFVAVVISFASTVALICALDQLVLRRVRLFGWFVYPRRPAATYR